MSENLKSNLKSDKNDFAELGEQIRNKDNIKDTALPLVKSSHISVPIPKI